MRSKAKVRVVVVATGYSVANYRIILSFCWGNGGGGGSAGRHDSTSSAHCALCLFSSRWPLHSILLRKKMKLNLTIRKRELCVPAATALCIQAFFPSSSSSTQTIKKVRFSLEEVTLCLWKLSAATAAVVHHDDDSWRSQTRAHSKTESRFWRSRRSIRGKEDENEEQQKQNDKVMDAVRRKFARKKTKSGRMVQNKSSRWKQMKKVWINLTTICSDLARSPLITFVKQKQKAEEDQKSRQRSQSKQQQWGQRKIPHNPGFHFLLSLKALKAQFNSV